MASEVKVKGMKEGIIVSTEDAIKLKELFVNESVPLTKRVAIGDWVGTKSEIKSVWIDRGGFKSKTTTIGNDLEVYLKERKAFQALPLLDRAKTIGFFKFLWAGFKPNEDVDDDTLAKVYALQEEFFEKNPYRILPDIILFKEIFGEKTCSRLVGSIASRSVQSDVEYSQQEINYYSSFKH